MLAVTFLSLSLLSHISLVIYPQPLPNTANMIYPFIPSCLCICHSSFIISSLSLFFLLSLSVPSSAFLSSFTFLVGPPRYFSSLFLPHACLPWFFFPQSLSSFTSSCSASGYFSIYGDECLHADHFDSQLATGDPQHMGVTYARTGYLGFLRRTENIQADGTKHNAVFIVGSLDETIMLRGEWRSMARVD